MCLVFFLVILLILLEELDTLGKYYLQRLVGLLEVGVSNKVLQDVAQNLLKCDYHIVFGVYQELFRGGVFILSSESELDVFHEV